MPHFLYKSVWRSSESLPLHSAWLDAGGFSVFLLYPRFLYNDWVYFLLPMVLKGLWPGVLKGVDEQVCPRNGKVATLAQAQGTVTSWEPSTSSTLTVRQFLMLEM